MELKKIDWQLKSWKANVFCFSGLIQSKISEKKEVKEKQNLIYFKKDKANK